MVVAVAAGLPLLVDAAGIPSTAARVGIVLAGASGVTRVMALPMVQGLLRHAGLTTDEPNDPLRSRMLRCARWCAVTARR
ncbi:hypothetical protein [Streptomyces sp. PT12]|uniref:hypothetical protein n=1 Tax=Streptomyces sp. PT12 TaxID=1510197 RepID=UPI002852CE95|nr:hypothetical protein [Streptomyces sp. PT12]